MKDHQICTEVVKMEITSSIKTATFLYRYILKYWSIFRNLCRPKLKIEFKIETFRFKHNDKEERRLEIPYISVKNQTKKTIHIDAKKIFLNNNCYLHMWGAGLVKEGYNNGFRVDNPDFLYPYYKENYLEISEGQKIISIQPMKIKIFPFMYIGVGISNLFSEKKQSKLFRLKPFTKNEVSFSVNINDYDYEYPVISREDFYKKYLSFLASYTSKFPRTQSIWGENH